MTRQNFLVTILSISMLAKSRILFSKFNHTKPQTPSEEEKHDKDRKICIDSQTKRNRQSTKTD